MRGSFLTPYETAFRGMRSSRLEDPTLEEVLRDFHIAGKSGISLTPLRQDGKRRDREDHLIRLKLLEVIPGRVWSFRISFYGRVAIHDLDRGRGVDGRLE